VVDQRSPEANIDVGDVKPFLTLFGGMVTQIIGARGDERNLPPADERYDYRCPCHLCGKKYDTYVGACLGAMRCFSDFAIINSGMGLVKGSRHHAHQAVHWLNEAQRAFKDKS
jgi:hypothetical protein